MSGCFQRPPENLVCGVSWQNFNEDRIEHLGLNYTNIYAGTEGAFFAEIEAAYKRGEPILAVNMWEPHWFMGKYDFTEIELPPYTDECWETTHACDWRPAELYNVARDPMETVDLAGNAEIGKAEIGHAEVGIHLDRLRAALAHFVERSGGERPLPSAASSSMGAFHDLDPETEQQLRDLGYLLEE